MSINYQTSSLCLIYEGKCIEILKGNLKDIDNITKKEVSKFDLLRELISNNSLDREVRHLLLKISEELPPSYLLDDEYNGFNFFITTKNLSKTIVLPILYNQYKLDNKDITKRQPSNENLYQILSLYNKKIETNPDNKNIIHDILRIQSDIMKGNLFDESLHYQELDEKKQNGMWLDDDTYRYYNNLKLKIRNIKSRDELLEKLLKNLEQTYYKKRSLFIIKKLRENELSEFNSLIALANNNEYEALLPELSEKTKSLRK